VKEVPEIIETAHMGRRVNSLLWDGDSLVDWVNGGTRYGSAGCADGGGIYYGDNFDAAVSSQCGRYSVVYTLYGTKGLLLRDGDLIREINRSYYFAESYP